MILDKSEFKSIGAVVDDDDFFKILTDQCHHLLLAVVELQIVVARVPVISLIESVVINCRPVGRAILISAVDDSLHVVRKVRAFAAGAGDHDHCGVGESLGVRHHSIRIFADGGLGQCPVLGPHAAHRPVRLVSGVEIAQLGVGLDPRIVKALQKAHRFISCVQSSGSAAAQHGIGGSPAKYIEFGPRCQRKNAFVL